MEKGLLQALALSVSFLLAIMVFPPSYFLGGNAVSAETRDASDTPPYHDVNGGGGGGTPTAPSSSAVPDGSYENPFLGEPISAVPEKKSDVSEKIQALAYGAAATALIAGYTFTLPATTQVADWRDPRSVETVPVRKNPYMCEKPGNYTLGAKLDTTNALSYTDKPLYTSGYRITVFGEVEALSATCSGLELECSEQRVQACKVDRIFMGYELKYEDCPKSFTQLHAEGARKHRSILGIVAFIAAMVAAALTAGAAFTVFGAISAKIAAVSSLVSVGSGAASKIAANNVANSIDDHPCFNVCGKNYKSQDPSNPFCNKGGPVIGYKKVEYSCNQASCGPARSKKVSIDVKSGTGSRIQRADTSTDGAGAFSFTFNAPPQDGDFFVFVKVPR